MKCLSRISLSSLEQQPFDQPFLSVWCTEAVRRWSDAFSDDHCPAHLCYEWNTPFIHLQVSNHIRASSSLCIRMIFFASKPFIETIINWHFFHLHSISFSRFFQKEVRLMCRYFTLINFRPPSLHHLSGWKMEQKSDFLVTVKKNNPLFNEVLHSWNQNKIIFLQYDNCDKVLKSPPKWRGNSTSK